MTFYEYAYENNFEELLTYYPRFYLEVFEMVEILKANGRILDVLQNDIEQTFLNHFVAEADKNTVEGWEEVFGVTNSSQLTLEQRRRVIIGLLCGNGHIGEPEIRLVVAQYTDHECSVDFADGIIYLVIREEIFSEELLLETLLRRIPAHLALNMSYDVRRQYRQTLNFNFGGAIGSDISGDFLPDAEREYDSDLKVSNLAYITSEAPTSMPDSQTTISTKTRGKQGLLYRTRLTSKLIKQEAN